MFFVYLAMLFSLAVSSDDLINAQLLYDENRYLDAKLLFETIEDKNVDVYYLGYQIYYKLDDLNKANEFLQLAVREDEDKYVEEGDKLGIFINDLRNAKVSLDNGFINESIEELHALTVKYPNNGIVYYRLGYAYKEMVDYDNAVLNLEKAKKLNPFNSTYSDLIITIAKIQEAEGQEEYKRQDYQAALNYFNKALEYDSTYSPVMFRIGNIYYKIKDYDKAIEMYKKGISYIDIAPNKYKLLNQLGKFYTKVNNVEKALEVFDKVLELQPGYDQALFEKAKIYKSMGEIDNAKLLLIQITDINPSFIKAYELLMDIEKDIKNYDKAIFYGDKCLDFNEESYTVLSRMATVYNEIGDFQKGKEIAKSATRINKKYAPAHFELGYAEMSLCNKVAAKDAFNKSKLDKRYRKISNNYLKNLDAYMAECEQ